MTIIESLQSKYYAITLTNSYRTLFWDLEKEAWVVNDTSGINVYTGPDEEKAVKALTQ
jgi:hypothetical protein